MQIKPSTITINHGILIYVLYLFVWYVLNLLWSGMAVVEYKIPLLHKIKTNNILMDLEKRVIKQIFLRCGFHISTPLCIQKCIICFSYHSTILNNTYNIHLEWGQRCVMVRPILCQFKSTLCYFDLINTWIMYLRNIKLLMHFHC